MALTPSKLSVIVESKGIEKAAVDLERLAKAGASVDAGTKGLIMAQAKLNEANAKAALILAKLETEQKKQETAIARTLAVTTESAKRQTILAEQQITAEIKKADIIERSAAREAAAVDRKLQQEQAQIQSYGRMQAQANKMNEAFDRKSKGLDEVTKRGNVYVNTLRSMATAASAYLGVNFVRGIISEADAWSMMQSKLKIALGDMNLAKSVQEDLFQISQKLRVPIEDATKLFTRMSAPLQKIGYSIKDTENTVASFATALSLAGATGQEASSAMLQFSQSINAGRLNGGEFNSVYEAAPNVMIAITEELVRSGKAADSFSVNLKKLASEGKLTTDILVSALLNAAPKWQKDFEQLPLTVDGALTRIKNAWQKAIGEVGKDTNFTKRISEALSKLESMLPSIAKGVGNALAFVVENAETLGKTFAFLVSLGTVKWIAETALSFKSLAGEIGITNVALQAFAAHPVVRIITLAAAAITGLGAAGWKLYKDMTEGATVANENLTKSAPELLKSMEDQYQAALKQYNVLWNIVDLKNKDAAKPIQHIQDASEIEQIEDKIRRKVEDINISRKNGSEVAIKQQTQELIVLSQQLQKAKELQETTEGLNKANKEEGDRRMRQKQFEELFNKYGKNENDQRKEKLQQLDEIAKKDGVLIMNAKEYAATVKGINEAFKTTPDKDPLANMKESLLKSKTTTEEWIQKLEQLKQFGIDDKRLEGQKRLNELEQEALQIAKEADPILRAKKQALNDQEMLDVRRRISIQQEYELTKKVESAWQDRLSDSEKQLVASQEELNKQQDLLAAYGKSAEQLEALSQARANDVLQKEKSIYADLLLTSTDEAEIKRQEKLIDNLKLINENRERAAKLKDDIAEKVSFDEQAAKYEQAYQSANKKIQDGLYNAIGKGGGNAIKKLIEDIKSWFARLILKPIIDPIAAFGASIISPQAKSAGDVTASITNLLNPMAWGTSAATALANGIGKAGAAMGSEFMLSVSSMMQGGASSGLAGVVASGLSAMSTAAPFLAAFQAFKSINGGYQIGGLSKDLQAATLGIAPRLFGMQDKQLTGETVSGALGTDNLTRNVSWTQKGGLFRSDRADTWRYGLKDSTAIQDGKAYVDTANLQADKALLNQLNDSYASLKQATAGFATSLGLSTETILKRNDQINFAFGKDAQETSANITKAFESIANLMATDLLKGLETLAKVGESSSQTLARLANTIGGVNSIFDALGYKLFDINESGIKAADAVVQLYGGLEKFQSVTKGYYDNFYTDAEKTEKSLKIVKEALKNLGISEAINTREEFRALVDKEQAKGNSALVKSLMELSSAFAAVVQWGDSASSTALTLDGVTETLKTLASEAEKWYNIRKQSQDIQSSIEDALGNPKKDPTAKIKELWEAMYSNMTLEQKMASANELKDLLISKYQTERDSITKLIEYGKQLKSYVSSLTLGSLSPLTMTEKLLEAKRQYDLTLTKAQSGDATAQAALQGSADTYLQLAQTAFASNSEYVTIFNNVTSALDALSTDAITAGDKQTEQVQQQIAELVKLKEYAASMEITSGKYYDSSLKALETQSKAAVDLYNKLGNLDGLRPVLASLPTDIAAAISGKFGETNTDFVKGLYGTYANKSGAAIDQQGLQYWLKEVAMYGKEYVQTAFVNAVNAPQPIAAQQVSTSNVASVIAELKDEIVKLQEGQTAQTVAIVEATITSNAENADAVVSGVSDATEKQKWAAESVPAFE